MASAPVLLASLAVSLIAFACKPSPTEPPPETKSDEPKPTSEEGEQTDEGEEPAGQMCGGIAAIQCPEGQSCVDDPRDDCDPEGGGADCSGVCKKD
jgi:hypothetical protein